MAGLPRIEIRGECLWADGRGADARAFAALCRALAVMCIERQSRLLLIDTTDCDAEGALAVRDAFTVMALAGIPAGFRVAIVASGPIQTSLTSVEKDLTRLRINVRLFDAVEAAADWLDCPRRFAAPVGEAARA